MKKILGLEEDQYNKMAESYSKANIFLWVLGGVIFNLYLGKLVSLSTLLLLFPGIFIISFVSILPFVIKIKTRNIITKTNNIFTLFILTVWELIDFILPITLSIIYIIFIEYLIILF